LHEVFLSIPSVRYTDKAEDQPGRAFEGLGGPDEETPTAPKAGVVGGGND